LTRTIGGRLLGERNYRYGIRPEYAQALDLVIFQESSPIDHLIPISSDSAQPTLLEMKLKTVFNFRAASIRKQERDVNSFYLRLFIPELEWQC